MIHGTLPITKKDMKIHKIIKDHNEYMKAFRKYKKKIKKRYIKSGTIVYETTPTNKTNFFYRILRMFKHG